MILKLEGALTIADARLLEEICTDLQDELRCSITIDLSGVNFLGSQSAEILCRLKSMPDLSIQGAHLFVEQILEAVENKITTRLLALRVHGSRGGDSVLVCVAGLRPSRSRVAGRRADRRDRPAAHFKKFSVVADGYCGGPGDGAAQEAHSQFVRGG